MATFEFDPEPEGEMTMFEFDRETMDLIAEVKRFVENYCRTFDANRADLVNLYQEESVMTFDGQEIQGKEGILAKLNSLPFQQCQHHIGTINCLPDGLNGDVFVLIIGKIRLDDVPFDPNTPRKLQCIPGPFPDEL
ncbi:hypothetical protein NL676_022344 [Syzygium grande]|nr:hypothetical protein NL676_022344 [Syzygium grande]